MPIGAAPNRCTARRRFARASVSRVTREALDQHRVGVLDLRVEIRLVIGELDMRRVQSRDLAAEALAPSEKIRHVMREEIRHRAHMFLARPRIEHDRHDFEKVVVLN